ncbi:nicotinate-nucleotide--dimethylbenzimidazole phosphoribosyltransferase [Colwellia psychrerythraea]|uniref:Nicotinate-nucleotide--dimethylbenzimidazole phosphoribosyltransferase n=1 Tax=Colwellia psychrerythraea (strain 34H / ATCC BAA-681) TaxID=167879 RepID=Q47XZ3_COLP3|nr:nicotinate-nucleotide--dimethylbenzimidazole phosphoribosyltransferase [Colwellia psychrerythraea]AAZ24800.1 putative nicotinate-nucleotide--dimethylbenzimidazole phosphoribosyltransferase [Colwellia psychrerythraea 34H]
MIPITPLNVKSIEFIQAQIDNKTKPLGALGALEPLALQLALITNQRHQKNSDCNDSDFSHSELESSSQISINNPVMLVFSGDHGINDNNVSIAPSAVTKQMVLNFLMGGAAINCFCQSNDIALTVVDCGILQPISADEVPQVASKTMNSVNFIEQRLGAGTNDFSVESAMSIIAVEQGFDYARQLVEAQVKQGAEILLLGEMGIANTSSAAALMSALTLSSVPECVGRGTGITDEQLEKKIALIESALQRVKVSEKNVENLTQDEIILLLSELGGFEIVQMVSAILSAATASIPVVIDGFIVSVAALVALRLDKDVANYLIFSHVSQENAHQKLLEELISAQTFNESSSQPLLNLGLRLGEGTGAALAFPLIKASASFYNNMASFESAGVTV